MEDIVVTDPVPVVEEPEITSAATTGPRPAEPTATHGSGGEDGSEASCAWSLTHKQQVHNFKENWKRVFTWTISSSQTFRDKFETNPWFASVVEQLRADPCLESSEFEVDQDLIVSGVRMTSLDLAILMGDLKMVQKIFERSSVADKLIRGLLVDPRALNITIIYRYGPPKDIFQFLYTPLHLAVAGGNSYIVDALLEKGADVNVRNWQSETPLDLACRMENVPMLLRLLEKDGKEGKHPLHVAVRHRNFNFLKELAPNFNALDHKRRTPLHHLATSRKYHLDDDSMKNTLKYLVEYGTLDMKALDSNGLSAFYVAVLCCNIDFVIELLDSFEEEIRLNEACDTNLGPPIQIAFEGGYDFRDIQSALMECDPVKSYMERLYRDRQVYVDAANAILVGAALIASVTFASWLQPPLNYTSYFGQGSSSSIPAPSISDGNYVDVEHNIALRAFWVFNALSFYFAIGSVVCGARSVLPRSHLFIKKTVEKLRTNLLMTSILLACSMLFVIIAFAIAGTIVLTPLLKYQWYMIVPTLVGGMVCLISLVFLVKSIREIYSNIDELNIRGYNECNKGDVYLWNKEYTMF